MHTLSCLQVAYEFLNREWLYLIYGEEKKTWYKSLKNWINRWHFYILDSINQQNDYEIRSKKNYQFLIVAISISLGAFFTAYKVMKILLSLEVKKSVMEFRWWRNENSNKMSPAFHENNNESPQLTEDFALGASLTAIIKPTIRTSETWETVKEKDDQQSSETESIDSKFSTLKNPTTLTKSKELEHNSDTTGAQKEEFGNMQKNLQANAENVDIIKPLVKCTSSLYVVTSKDSLNAEFHTELITENTKFPRKINQKKGMKIVNKVNNNVAFDIHESSSVSEVDDVISTLFEDTINHYQCSISSYASPDTPALHKNSSYVLGHFVEKFPDLDLSPISNLSPNNRNHEQSLKIEPTNKEVQEIKSKFIEPGYNHPKYISDTGRGSSNQKFVSNSGRESSHQKLLSDTGPESIHQTYLSSSLTGIPSRCDKSPKKFLTCFDFETNLYEQHTSNCVDSKIPRLNFTVEYNEINEEGASRFSKLVAFDTAGSKIPIPLRKFQPTNVSTEGELNESPEKSDSIQTEQKKETEIDGRLDLKESKQSLERFLQLEIATGCYSASDFRYLQPFPSKS